MFFKRCLWLLVVLCALEGGLAIMFNLHPNSQKCLKDESQPKELVIGEYEVSKSNVPESVVS